ncbi:CapA family protein [Mesorhizobium sp. VK23B]|uniref:CapA family protein n=1 Tax=Mesorhizobium dulcispinae TaxID=3072316 RepID=A0ABU4XQ98_9HYPH|nr:MULTISPECIES: CapA family protein [unclassified Mesorhizobium]MDX8470347.1 CapA family protein [Mesorhizobium sp. VK23B]MDX8476733.1 CapA family protein [Mesorhizobium sp. VK23A]
MQTTDEIHQTGETSFEIRAKEILEKAMLSHEWDVPLAGAATDAAEMSHVDLAYWFYKLARPTLVAESGVRDALFASDKSVIQLPAGFKQESALTLSAAGDLMPMDGIEASANIIYEKVRDILFDADISFANLEAPLTKEEFDNCLVQGCDLPKGPILRNSFAMFDALVRHNDKSFDVLSVANNHTFDLGVEGIETTRKVLVDNNIIGIGTPGSQAEYGRADIITKADIKVGFISATFSLNDRNPPENESYRVHTARLVSKYVEPELELLNKQIEDCKREGCDVIVASLHWGYEFEFFPRSKQIEAAHALIEGGVDLILGHHPHVVQPVEYYRTKRDPNRMAVIAYSLGGLTYDQWDAAPHLALGLALRMNLSKGIMDGTSRTFIDNIRLVPVFHKVFCQNGRRTLRIEKLDDHLSEAVSLEEDKEFVGRVNKMKCYADLVLGKWAT